MSRMHPIGIFDSGLGGLSVLKEIKKLLPNETLIFFADSAHCPYGPKSKKDIIKLSEKIVEFLLEQNCKAIVVACNTATAAAIKHLRSKWEIPFIGIEPAVKPAASDSRTGTIGVLATEGTFEGDHFKNTSQRYAENVKVITKVGHELVELVEQMKIDTPYAENLIAKYIKPMIHQGVDQIVLGCTHYPFLIPVIKKFIPDDVRIINPAPAVAKQTKAILEKHDLLNQLEASKATYHFFSSGDEKRLETFVRSSINCESEHCTFKHVKLTD